MNHVMIVGLVALALTHMDALQDPQSRAASRAGETRPTRVHSSISGVILWSEIEPEKRKFRYLGDEARVVDDQGRLANAVVALIPLEGQDLSKIPPAQRAVSEKDRQAPDSAVVHVDLGLVPSAPVQVHKNADREKGVGSISFGVSLGANRDQGGNVSIAKRGSGGQGRFFDDLTVYRFTTVTAPPRVLHVLSVTLGEHRITGADGAFRFEGLPEGEYELAVWHASGRKHVREVLLGAEKPLKLEIELR